MATKKVATQTKATPKKAEKKAAPAKKASPSPKPVSIKKKAGVGSVYECRVCGLIVSVIEDCGCVGLCDLICCEAPMKQNKTKAR